MSDVMISAENVSKLYRIGASETQHESLAGAVLSTLSAPLRNFKQLKGLDTSRSLGRPEQEDLIWALRDVSFEVKQGEVVGIIGRNGAGKSTLLKILSRVTVPTSGRVRMTGRVSSLLEVGTGFHPELTGRDNVYLNGTILGMTRREIDRKFDEIVEFSGISKFLDTPIKRYSSGMKVRLAFAVAAYLEPEILIIDEVLAVGDMEFQNRCINKMKHVAGDSGRTVLFVSHNMSSVAALCDRVVLLDGGRVKQIGDTQTMIRAYMHDMIAAESIDLAHRTDREGDGQIRCTKIWITDPTGRPSDQVRSGDDIQICVQFEAAEDGEDLPLDFILGLYDSYGVSLARLSTQHVPLPNRLLPSSGVVTCLVPRLPLPAGEYSLNVGIMGPGNHRFDRVESAFRFNVHDGDFHRTGKIPTAPTKILLDHSWYLDDVRASLIG